MYDDLFSSQEGVTTIVTSPHKLHASLRIYHDDLQPDDLTRLFGVSPTDTQRKGEALKPFKPTIKTLRIAPTGCPSVTSRGSGKIGDLIS
ncbi:MAG: hypothetical protein DKT66_21280 [Candidatus Melainabacteria bacterium]|nr:MAG: hypothetical protein DKT66_21280 [Candidatus Melainabacteria bacterium]